MSYLNGTTHYNLPQTVGTDKRDWFDTNAAFAAVDAALYAAATGQASDAEAITALQQTVAGQATDIAALQTASNSHAASISALQTTVNGQATQIADVRQDAEDMITANNEGAAATSTRAYAVGDYFIYNDVMYKATAAIAIGGTIVPNTNCVATNVDTELSQLNSDLTGYIMKENHVAITVTNSGSETVGQILAKVKTAVTNKLASLNDNEYITFDQLIIDNVSLPNVFNTRIFSKNSSLASIGFINSFERTVVTANGILTNLADVNLEVAASSDGSTTTEKTNIVTTYGASIYYTLYKYFS